MPQPAPTSSSLLLAKAHRYDGEMCRAMVLAANATRWRSICSGAPGHSKLFDAELCGGGGQIYRTGVTTATGKAITYVRNQKAASQLLTYELSSLFGLAGPPRHGVQLARKAPANASTFVFSFVRDPLDTALDAYLELRHLATLRSPSYRAAMARAVGAAEISSSNHALVIPPCRSPADATRQFRLFLEALKRGDALGGDAYHAFPQALKLDHMGVRSTTSTGRLGTSGSIDQGSASSVRMQGYDAIGHVESMEADLQGMRKMLGLQVANLSKALQSSRHSHRHEACAQVDKKDARIATLVCDLYAADYACFGYRTPAPTCTAVGVQRTAAALGIETFSLGIGL